MNVETVLHGFCVKYEKIYYNLIAPVNCFPLRAAVSTTEQLTGVTALSAVAAHEGSMMSKTIQLTQGKVAIVDDDMYDCLSQWKWQVSKRAGLWYAVRTTWGGLRENIPMHREITNAPDGMVVDHINGNGLDNRRANLRVCTHTENMRNRRVQKNNTTGYKGVSVFSPNRFQVKIKVDGKLLHVGLFKDIVEAAKAYDNAAKKYYGEFARLNFPGGAR